MIQKTKIIKNEFWALILAAVRQALISIGADVLTETTERSNHSLQMGDFYC